MFSWSKFSAPFNNTCPYDGANLLDQIRLTFGSGAGELQQYNDASEKTGFWPYRLNQSSVKMDDKESSDNSSKINKFHNPNFREPKNTVAMGISLFGAKLSQMTR